MGFCPACEIMEKGFYGELGFLRRYWFQRSSLPECSLGGIVASRIDVLAWVLLILALLPLTIERSRIVVTPFKSSTLDRVHVDSLRDKCDCDSSGWTGVIGLHGVTVKAG